MKTNKLYKLLSFYIKSKSTHIVEIIKKKVIKQFTKLFNNVFFIISSIFIKLNINICGFGI